MSRLRASRQLATGWLARVSYFLPPLLSPDYEPELERTIKRVRRHTMTTPRRIAALCDSVEHVVRAGVPGAVVECGVWRGGSMMAAALTLLRLGAADRELYLFDTFAGMPPPTTEDVFSAYDGYNPMRHWRRRERGGHNKWHYVPAEDVRAAVLSTGYPAERVHLVEGRVEDTLPGAAPDEIAVLRLDTDWYASTRHELEQLYPRLSAGGVLILDDYGHYEGARRAVDEYFEAQGGRPLLSRIDYTGRVGVKRGR
ncbi:MAG: O-methyltransferase [Thermoleophilaceae bacterium]|nr:O-methyltransferase [Thermoleophilaceae bacterium]